ncbi:erythroblast NAD(P)(+)--arginine ADP-ribosyltransferase-like isoform X1 [Zonotrichia leucophrys gambelii]|uniref:erythroblast NAD(P)(+)--arginine ADP-ribosyltransferase-like isoform X1 n=2 Tax=Zonotrichia leucophrys gambelii TaxID=257770 RepID=UPI0031406A1A
MDKYPMAKSPVTCRTRRDPLVPHWSLWPLLSMAPLAQTLALLAMAMATTAVDVIPLDMALDSFDDQYQDCGTKMMAELSALNHSEFQQNPLFAQAWLNATAVWRGQKCPVPSLSSPAQAIALMAYTMDELYREFNAAVRVAGRSRQEYRDNFHFKTLHFLLTQALVTLRQAQNGQCHNVSRGVRMYKFKAKPGDIVRFGQFSSASESEKTAKRFGSATMFQVYTCHGAAIWNFSKYPGEKEVLIPPFETFKVVEVSQEGDSAWIQLWSNGTFSKYNCEWLQGDVTGGSIPRAPFHLGGLLATTTLAAATGIL